MKVAVINSGGTISCIGSPLAPMSSQDFANASEKILNPILQQQFPDIDIDYLCDIEFPESNSKTLDSTNLQPADWCIMANGVLNNYANYDAFLILHGTDSMDFTGGALPFLLNTFDTNGNGTAVLSKPVIITGSQVPLYYQENGSPDLSLNFNTDAYQNMCGAIACARTGIPEVCVYFQNQLYRGNRVLKTNASEFNAFSSPNYPALAECGVELSLFNKRWLPGPVDDDVSLDNADILKNQTSLLNEIQNLINNYPIAQLNAFPAQYNQSSASAFMADMVSAICNTGIKGLILESYGEGNFPSGNPDTPSDGAIYTALKEANNNGVNIVDCTQVISGTVNNTAYASGAWLPHVGALTPADMSPMCALGKLTILSTIAGIKAWTREQLQILFQSNLTGEMSSINNIDSRSNSVLMAGQIISTLDGSAQFINDQKQGPILVSSSDQNVLWKLPVQLNEEDLPGRLVMQDDGNLVFYNRFNKALWASNTGNPSGASSKLILSGHYNNDTPSDSDVLLQVFDYSSNTVTSIIYQS
ncbi:asparaginase domain-containing protein [Agaribacterium sp. ZY112]|uniref:asparaginase domain-containing protein n=1 Tax=Agaribacterium sp. ZY112 TaxID=3233574 RepID=UPI003523974F